MKRTTDRQDWATRRRPAPRIFVALLCLGAAFVGAQAPAAAQSGEVKWPDRPVRFIVPFPAGSASDIVARIVTQKLGAQFGQQFVIDNRSGASGNIGVEAIARAAPDGYTIGLGTTSTHALAATLTAKLPYNPVSDFAPVAMIGASPYVLAVNPSVPARTVAELIALARSKPGALSYGSAGQASLAHLAGELFSQMAGVQFTHVPYRSSAQAVLDVAAGRVEVQFATLGPTLEQIRADQLRAIAVTSAMRIPSLPDVPTVQESGLPGYDVVLWMAVFAPAGVPAPILSRLEQAMHQVLNDPDVAAALRSQGMEPMIEPSAAVAARVRDEIAKWRQVVGAAKLKGPP